MYRMTIIGVALAAAAAAAPMDLEVTRVNVDDVLVAGVRFQGPYSDVGPHMAILVQAVGDKATGPYLAVYYDSKEVEVHDIEVCVPVAEPLETEAVSTHTLAGGEFMKAVHRGAFDTLSDTYRRFHAYCVANLIPLTWPGREVYVAFNPDDLSQNVTELLMPVATEEPLVERKAVGEMLVASIRFRGAYEEVGNYMEPLYRHAGEYAVGPCFALYYENGTEEGHDIEVCVPVSEGVEAEGITSRVLPAAEVVSTVHRGPYGVNLNVAWVAFLAYVKNRGVATEGPAREIYLEWNPDDPTQYVTELQLPVVTED
jgi:effector-binding domain-containing protein